MHSFEAQLDDPNIGQLLDGRYRIGDPIGAGAMGTVYLATQVRIDRPVAVKLLRPEFGNNEKVVQRFEREAKAIGRLNHPACITLFDYGYSRETEGLFMVTELVNGSTLDQIGIALDPQTIMRVGYEIADALNHAHRGGIVHRDMKPGNVMLVQDDVGRLHAKVLDFGLALLFDPEGSICERRLSSVGEIHGSPRYMSPEQCRGEHDISTGADIYSLGVILYELFAGRPPFEAAAIPTLLLSHLHDEVPDIHDTRVPADVEQLLYEMLAKDSRHRPSAAEARDVLARHIDTPSTGDLAIPSGLAEDTLDSEAYDDAKRDDSDEFDAPLEVPTGLDAPVRLDDTGEMYGDECDEELAAMVAAEIAKPRVGSGAYDARPVTGSFELLARSPEARHGAVVGAIMAVLAIGMCAALILML